MKKIESNIWKIYVIKALRWFMLVMPIIVLFYNENGLGMKEVLLLQAIFSIAMIIFELPSGYFSDVIGRRETMIVGCVFGFIGFLIYPFSQGFWGFLLAELMLGLGSSFLSGTDSAIIYDSLIEVNRENEYKKIEGRMLSLASGSEAIASFLGGFLALISLRTPFYLEAFIMLFTIPIAFSLLEPKRKKFKNKHGSIKGIMKIVNYSVRHNGEIKWLIFYSGFVSTSTLAMVWFAQPYFKQIGLPLQYYGLIWGLLNLSVAVFALYAHKFEKLLGRKKALTSLIFVSFLGYLLVGFFDSLWAIAFVVLFYFVRGVHNPILNDYVNKLISSDMRATVLSVKNMFARIVFAVIGPLLGWTADIYSLQLALLTSGCIFVVLGSISLLFLRKHKAL